jgi:cytidine deaminase
MKRRAKDNPAGDGFSAWIDLAHGHARPIKPSRKCEAGTVAALLVTPSGGRYVGVSVEFRCGIGFCAEHAAVAEMLKNHETRVTHVVAVHHNGKVLAPCGRCREMLWQLDDSNRDCLVILGPTEARPLHELLPHPAYP